MHGVIVACDENKMFLKQLIDKTIIERLVDIFKKIGIEKISVIFDDCYSQLYDLFEDKVEYISKNNITFGNDDILILDSSLACVTSDFLKKLINEFLINKNDIVYSMIKILNNKSIDDSLLLFSNIDNNEEELYKVKDFKSLSIARKIIQKRINYYWLEKGVDIEDVDNIVIGEDVIIKENVSIKSHSKVLGKSIIESCVFIGENSHINSSIINEKSTCKYSTISNSIIGKNSTIGPYANIHTNTVIGDNSRIGNYVEIKKSILGNNNKASHLIYIGDTVSGDNVNFGCGSITVNYNGISKNKTKIGNNVFIGCNTNLIAPVEVEDDSYIAAGSTINMKVNKGSLAISRCKQINKEGYHYLKKIEKKGL